uniref:Clathrin light chain n=1 Tax=Parastrongyloides trichosuri TaxID=131310 RepID=A0A0N4ZWX9_PARTI
MSADQYDLECEQKFKAYKDQFLEWKEKNKSAEGTKEYISYVKQFENWEKSIIEKRLQHAKKKQAALEESKKKEEAQKQLAQERLKAEQEMKQQYEYAQYNDQYRQTHINAMTRGNSKNYGKSPGINDNTGANVSPSLTTTQVTHTFQKLMESMRGGHTVSPLTTNDNRDMSNNLKSVNDDEESLSGDQFTIIVRPVDAPVYIPETNIKLSDIEPPSYNSDDPMFAKWAFKAAPPNTRDAYMPPIPPSGPQACWMMLEAMKDQKLIISSSERQPPMPLIPQFK